MSTKLIVKIQNSEFPVRINGARYHNGDELEINESQLNPKVMEVIETIKENVDPLQKLKVEELKAIAEEKGIVEFDKMKKDELIAAIKATESE